VSAHIFNCRCCPRQRKRNARNTVTKKSTYKACRSEEASHSDLAWATMHALYNEPITGDSATHRNIIEVF